MSGSGTVVSPDGGELIDLGQGKLWLGFVLRSLRRHKKRALATFLAISALGIFFGLSGEKLYASDTLLLVKNDRTALNAVNGPSGGGAAEPPAVLAKASILDTTNLEKVVDDLKLVERETVNEGTFAGLKRKLFETVFGAADPKKKRDNLVNKLRASIGVSLDDKEQVKQTVTVSLLWNDPVQAKEILDQVNVNYLARRKQEDIEPLEQAREVLSQKFAEKTKEIDALRLELNLPVQSIDGIPDGSPLKPALDTQAELGRRLQQTELSLAAAEPAFALNNKVNRPPEVPLGPISGSLKTMLAGILAGAMLAAFVTAATDLSKGKVVEPWQVSRGLNLPLLAELPK